MVFIKFVCLNIIKFGIIDFRTCDFNEIKLIES